MTTEQESCCSRYFKKFTGGEYETQAIGHSVVFSGIVSSLLMFTLLVITNHTDFPMVASSFAATAALLSAAPQSPLSQPRNVVGGHVIGALTGHSIYRLTLALPHIKVYNPVINSISVGLTISLSSKLRLLHPPAAATAIVASTNIYDEDGFLFVVRPVLVGSIVLVLLACILNNISTSRSYPMYW